MCPVLAVLGKKKPAEGNNAGQNRYYSRFACISGANASEVFQQLQNHRAPFYLVDTVDLSRNFAGATQFVNQTHA